MPPITTTLKPGIHVTFELSPMWYTMAREFASVTEDVLHEAMLEWARGVGQEQLNQIRIHALPFSYTGRLADVRRPGGSWRLYITPQSSRGRWYVTVMLSDKPREVAQYLGRPVRAYAGPMERGTGAHSRPWGKMARLRMEAWAEVKLGDRRRARYVMASISRHGTKAHPYFEPAARATERAASDVAEDYGVMWRDGVESKFGGGTYIVGY